LDNYDAILQLENVNRDLYERVLPFRELLRSLSMSNTNTFITDEIKFLIVPLGFARLKETFKGGWLKLSFDD